MQSYTKPNPTLCLTPTQTRQLYGTAPIYGANFRGQGRTVAIATGWFPAQQRSSVLCEVFASNSGSWRWFQRKSHLGWRSGRHDPSGGGEGDLDIQMVLGQHRFATS